MNLDDLDRAHYATNGVRLHVVQAGPAEGPLVILLHGFPEFWYGWRSQIVPLARAGFRVLAPDQRGYNLSDKPRGLAAYRLDELAADVVGLIDAAGRERVNLVGHDWGAIVAWWAAIHYPERLERMAILNAPHPQVMERALRRGWAQRLRSAYALFFQLPVLPEAAARLGNWRLASEGLKRSSLPGAFTEEDLQRYREAWGREGAMGAMLNWYRALLWHRPKRIPEDKLTVPTLVIWGARDAFLRVEMAEGSARMCEEAQLEVLAEATHWLQHERPERVNRRLLSFLDREPGSSPADVY